MSVNTDIEEKSQDIINRLPEMVKKATLAHFKKDQVLFYKGHLPCGLFILKKGRVSLPSEVMEKVFIADHQENILLGLNSFVCEKLYEETCRALDDVEVFFLSKSTINLRY